MKMECLAPDMIFEKTKGWCQLCGTSRCLYYASTIVLKWIILFWFISFEHVVIIIWFVNKSQICSGMYILEWQWYIMMLLCYSSATDIVIDLLYLRCMLSWLILYNCWSSCNLVEKYSSVVVQVAFIAIICEHLVSSEHL